MSAADEASIAAAETLIGAASDARILLSKLSSRLEITDELRAEIDAVEERLWNALFPGGASGTKKKR